ncbi:NAD-dependent epimerase/dehydratase family protein [Alicyclobacillus acidiphilus]|uniref:NAD-dependent epimerase/dehydratase family protein n=1 Tax=Alicyclobacillus acidiphilus TaxID=182455 RepID=UPI000830EE68|nr:NAD-dependent epimerase/dehydratase family protein [Alicyclobacillus acidiphilus]
MSRHRVLVTGANGFVGQHMLQHLRNLGVECVATGRSRKEACSTFQVPYYSCDLRRLNDVQQLMSTVQPTCVIHLASDTNLSEARNDPTRFVYNNVLTTVNLLESGTTIVPTPHVVVIGSAHEYAAARTDSDRGLPYTEESPTRPANPYGWSKLFQTYVTRHYAYVRQCPTTIARTFNLIGPGAKNGICAKIANSIVQMERGEMEPNLVLGPTHMQRDFLDVRDAVSAYWHLADRAPLVPGEVFNVCSGTAIRLSHLVEMFRSISRVPFRVVEDAALSRPEEPEIVRGSAQKLRDATGWSPKYTLKQSIADILADCRAGYPRDKG